MTDFASVYRTACEKTCASRATRDALLETPDEFIAKVSAARQSVLDDILGTATDKILDAAERGYGAADVLTFNGNDFVNDISLLFLLKGPRPTTPPIPYGTPPPLLPELQARMAPFDIVHDWDGISGGNRVIARWAPIGT
jgi:hypothetical protein